MTIAFKILPQEPLYYGPPASLPAGDVHHGESQFPPPFSAWQGLIRTRLLEAAGLDLQDSSGAARAERASLVGTPDALPENWCIHGPVPFRETSAGELEGWFPTPLWIHRAKDDADHGAPPRPLVAAPMKLPEPDLFLSDLAWRPVPIGAPKAGRTSPLGGWLSTTDLLRVLKGGTPENLSPETWEKRKKHWDLPPFVHWETRPGLALDANTGTVREGMLYFVRTLRFSPGTGLAGWLEGPLHPEIPGDALHGGTLTSGRKARPIEFAPLNRMAAAWKAIRGGDYLPKGVPDGFRCWLYLASAAHIPDPAHPPIASPDPDVRIDVRGALLHKPVWQGGFSIETGRVRPNLPFVPAGSAWLVHLSGGTEARRAGVLSRLHGSSPLVPASRAAFGEGRVYIGLIPTT